jgi:hypothetical protein
MMDDESDGGGCNGDETCDQNIGNETFLPLVSNADDEETFLPLVSNGSEEQTLTSSNNSNSIACNPSTSHGCISPEYGLCIPTIGCSGGEDYLTWWFENVYPSIADLKFDPSRVDWVDIGITLFGMSGDVALGTFTPIGVAYWGVTEIVEFVGMTKAMDEAEMGNLSGVGIEFVGRLADGVELVPGLGFYVGVGDIILNLSQGFYY